MSDQGDPLCPYFGGHGDCAHLPLVVDATFRIAEGGALMKVFNRRWAAIRAADPEAGEREAFEQLLAEVELLADVSSDNCLDSMPGMSSGYKAYFISSPGRERVAAKLFDAAG